MFFHALFVWAVLGQEPASLEPEQGLSHAAFSSFSPSQSLFIVLQLTGNLLQGKWKVRAEAQVGVTQKVKVFIQCCAHIYD